MGLSEPNPVPLELISCQKLNPPEPAYQQQTIANIGQLTYRWDQNSDRKPTRNDTCEVNAT